MEKSDFSLLHANLQRPSEICTSEKQTRVRASSEWTKEWEIKRSKRLLNPNLYSHFRLRSRTSQMSKQNWPVSGRGRKASSGLKVQNSFLTAPLPRPLSMSLFDHFRCKLAVEGNISSPFRVKIWMSLSRTSHSAPSATTISDQRLPAKTMTSWPFFLPMIKGVSGGISMNDWCTLLSVETMGREKRQNYLLVPFSDHCRWHAAFGKQATPGPHHRLPDSSRSLSPESSQESLFFSYVWPCDSSGTCFKINYYVLSFEFHPWHCPAPT